MNHYSTRTALFFAALAWHLPSIAQEVEAEIDVEVDAAVERETRKCISTRFIRRIRILNDQNVLIYLGPKRIYHNVLRQNCAGLKRVGSFSYNSSDGVMCEGDGIAAALGAWGDVRPTPGCWLGTHTRISREQANAMRAASKRPRVIKAAPVPPPEPSDIGAEEEEEPES